MRLKRLEQWWKTLWIALLVRLMRRAGDGAPDWGSKPTRVLFLRHDRAGDMILSTGVMRSIAESHPTIRLDVLASPINASLIEEAPFIDQVIVFDKRRLSSYVPTIGVLRRAKYDAVIDCMVTAPSLTTLLLILASGARYRIGIAGRGNDVAFNVLVRGERAPDAHMVDRIAALATAFRPELSADERQPVLEISAEERSRADAVWGAEHGTSDRVLINISAGSSERTWPSERYVAVMRHVRSRSPSAVMRVISAPRDVSRAELIAHGGGGEVVRTATIREAIALVATADFVFTPDTSIAHAASAMRRPAVAIYGRGSKSPWALYGTRGESVEHTESDLSGLEVDRVLKAIDAVWTNELIRSRG
jgi:ADP-heptose:LPS heptosyltransferase